MASTYLTKTFGSAGNRKTWTFSAWIKKTALDVEQNILMGGNTSYNDAYIRITGGNQLRFLMPDGTTTVGTLNTTQVLRDTSAWYHIVCVYDSSNATSSERMRIYINGNRITDFSTELYPSQNQDSFNINNASPHYIGAKHDATTFFDGSMSHIHFIDGTVYTPSAFGETDANGVWKIKTDVSVTYGTNGFFILKNGNSVTDQSGNSNNFTISGGTLTNTEDCPSNVFATLNPLDYSPNPATLENGNTSYNKSSTGAGNNASMTGTLGAMTGKWYYEFKPTNTSSFVTGMIRTNHDLPNVQGYYATDAGSYSITNSGKIVGGSESSVSYSYSANDIFGMAYDLDNGKFYFHVNGTYINSGDPTSGATGTGSLGDIALGSNIYVPLVSNANYDQTNLMHFNFGNGYFGTTAVSSAGTNASGIGIFEYDVPSGYTALSTKGLNL